MKKTLMYILAIRTNKMNHLKHVLNVEVKDNLKQIVTDAVWKYYQKKNLYIMAVCIAGRKH
jgi:hypothetical protein